ncbi:MAG: ribosome small subunit-dependent GTPase A [Syntrophomonadaceae bacterium]
MIPEQLEGLVIKNYSGFYYVQDDTGTVHACKVRGKVREKLLSGDRVVFTPLELGQGVLERVLPRKNELSRPRVANISRVLIVMAYNQPRPDLSLLDRLLFLAEYNRIVPYIILNKCDLEGHESVEEILRYYPRVYKVIRTSARQDIGIGELAEAIAGEIAVFAGPSGVGKSRLLQRLTGQSAVRTGSVSAKIGRGKHTTRHVELYPLPQGGWIVDTPGFSVLDLPAIRREELTRYFPDFTVYSEACRFGDCIHYRERDCGVKTALENNQVLPSRYKNYLAMLAEIIDKETIY